MTRLIEHNGVVERTAADRVFVRIVAQEACAACRAKDACGMGGQQQKIFEVISSNNERYQPGDAVRLGITTSLGNRAALLAYVLPCIVLFGTLASVLAAGAAEGAAALSALGATALYYVVLWLLRRKIENQIKITITKI